MSSFMSQWVYTDTVKDHFMNPRNLWDEKEDFQADGIGEVGSLACGDQMRVGIQVKDDKISALRWLTYGCASAIASTSMMSELAVGMSLEDAYHITPNMITDALGGLPEHKFHCSVLGDKALRAAIDDYLDKTAKIVFIGPCTAKKAEARKPEVRPYIDAVITFEELQALTGASTACGKCRGRIKEHLEEMLHIYGK